MVLVMYACERWAIKKAEHRRIDAFKLWCWRRLLRVPWTARRSNQSILKEINPEYSLEGLILKLKFQYFGHLMQRASLLEKTLILQMISLLHLYICICCNIIIYQGSDNRETDSRRIFVSRRCFGGCALKNNTLKAWGKQDWAVRDADLRCRELRYYFRDALHGGKGCDPVPVGWV